MRTLLPPLLSALFALGCVHAYAEPALHEPHALVRVRSVHHSWAGTTLEEVVRLNGYDVALPRATPTVPATRAMRVRPEATRWRVGTTYFHVVPRSVLRTYTRQEACGSYTTGYGNYRSTQTRYCTRTESRWETVYERVIDAACEAELGQLPLVGGAYILQYDFYAHGQCTLQCLRQIPSPDGSTFTLVPCGANEPPGIVGTPPALPPTSGGAAAVGAPSYRQQAPAPAPAAPAPAWETGVPAELPAPEPATTPGTPAEALGTP